MDFIYMDVDILQRSKYIYVKKKQKTARVHFSWPTN